MKPNKKPLPDLPPKKKFLAPVLAVLFGLLLCEIGARVVLKTNLKDWERTRQLLRGDITPSPTFAWCTSQAYLLYIPTPNYTDNFGYQHNEHGYRGKLVPMERRKGITRILCLGGSTTYGQGQPYPKYTYPALLESLLNEGLPEEKYEVINAGIPWGTTAENLTHYHFKFHFYRPDIVVLNPGGNDAEGLTWSYYTPDYSNWRKSMSLPEPLPPLGRKLLQSRLMSLLLIPVIYSLHPGVDSFVRTSGLPPLTSWYSHSPGRNLHQLVPKIPEDEIAFKHNLETLLDELAKDKCKVLLVPFRPSPFNQYDSGIKEAMNMEESILKKMAEERHLAFAPFPATTISPKNWVDSCHTNAEGYLEKARHIFPFVKKLVP